MKVILAPSPLNNISSPTVFMAGSIEQGQAKKWHKDVYNHFENHETITFLNPRRENWDSTLSNDIENDVFRGQVEWELDGILEKSDVIFFYFQEKTLSPISLLELGLVLASNIPTVVVCEHEFWRKGNIDITTKRYNVPVYTTLKEGINTLKQKLTELEN